MTSQPAILWIDHHDAKIFRLEGESFHATHLESPHRHVRRHSETTAERKHPADATHYYHEVAGALSDASAILVVGPATAKLEFIKHVHHHDPLLVPRIVGVETVDHPTDGQLVAYARHYFQLADRVR